MNNLLKTYKFSNFRVVKGNGCYLYTSDKRKLLDFSAGVAVNSLGYNHPVVRKSLQDQIKTGITHLSGSQMHEFKTKLSKLLSEIDWAIAEFLPTCIVLPITPYGVKTAWFAKTLSLLPTSMVRAFIFV